MPLVARLRPAALAVLARRLLGLVDDLDEPACGDAVDGAPLAREHDDEAAVAAELPDERRHGELAADPHEILHGLGQRQRPELVVGGRGEDGDAFGPVPVELAVPPGADPREVVLQGEPALPLGAVRLRRFLELGEEGVELRLGPRSGRRRRWIQVDIEADRAAVLGPEGRKGAQDVVGDGGGHGAVLSGRPRSIPEEHPAARSRLLLQTDFRRGALL